MNLSCNIALNKFPVGMSIDVYKFVNFTMLSRIIKTYYLQYIHGDRSN